MGRVLNYVCVICAWILTIGTVRCFTDEYHWRDYTGKIAFDAVPGGRDLNNETTYIGQVYIKEQGIFPTTIVPGDKEIFAPVFGPKKSQGFVQILCGNDIYSSFEWKVANNTHLHLQTIDDLLVKGGIEDGQMLYIGRVKYQGELIVGKVLGGSVENAMMYFVYKDSELESKSYEVLKVEKRNIIDLRTGPFSSLGPTAVDLG